MSRRFAPVRVLGGLGLVGLGFVLGARLEGSWALPPATASPAAPVASDDSRFRKLDLFARALAAVEQHYVRPLDGDELVYAAIRGLVAELDPHTEFLAPREARLLREEIEGVFGGVGMSVTLGRDEHGRLYLAIQEVVAGGPAAAVGVVAGNRVTAIEGRPIAQFGDLRQAIMTMRGAPGSRVRFTVEDPERKTSRAVTVVRARIASPPAEVRYLGEGLGVIRLREFPERSAQWVERGLTELRERARAQGLRGVVLDLRDNGGGLLGEAIALSDLFLDSGTIVYTRGRRGEVLDTAVASRPGTERDLPIVVLIDKGSASASEIVAGALQDHRRALVLGERSFGKGSVQAPFELGDGSLLKLTIALYYTPADRLIQASGIAPDVWVDGAEPAPARDSRPEIEPERSHPRHLDPAQFGREAADRPVEGPALSAAGGDRQLAAAVQHLLAWDRLGPGRRRR